MYLNRGYTKVFLTLIISLLILHNVGTGQPFYSMVKVPSTTISPNCGGYWEFLPPGYTASDKTKLYPLIIVMHGAGAQQPSNSSEYDLDKLLIAEWYEYSLTNLIDKNFFPTSFNVAGVNYSFIVMAPQCQFIAGIEDIRNYLDHAIANYNVDPRRVFLTGYSIGGSRTWVAGGTDRTLTERFAGIIPMSAGADDNYVYCPTYPTTPCSPPSDNTDFFKVVNNLSPVGYNTPKVLALTGINDYNRQFNIDYVTKIKEDNPFSDVQLINFADAPNDHIGVYRRGYDPNSTDINGSNIYTWMLNSANALLPVTLASFDARAVSKEVLLTWSTASESNSSHFSVERSSNGKDFNEIGKVNSNGNSSTAKNYSFTDKAPLSGNSYYRLKMVDRDASFEYSGVKKISLNGSDLEFTVGPNPVANEARIKISGMQRGSMQISITDLMGRTVKTLTISKTANEFSQSISLSTVAAGQYILSIRGENINYTQRLIKR